MAPLMTMLTLSDRHLADLLVTVFIAEAGKSVLRVHE